MRQRPQRVRYYCRRCCLCTVCLFASEAKKHGFGTKQSIFYVTVRSRSESGAWPIFGAPWRHCLCSMLWKPWLLLFITILQGLQCIRGSSCGQMSTRHSCISSAGLAVCKNLRVHSVGRHCCTAGRCDCWVWSSVLYHTAVTQQKALPTH